MGGKAGFEAYCGPSFLLKGREVNELPVECFVRPRIRQTRLASVRQGVHARYYRLHGETNLTTRASGTLVHFRRPYFAKFQYQLYFAKTQHAKCFQLL